MAMKMEINRLDRDEFMYELTLRGIKVNDETTVAEMRKTLRQLLKLEKGGSTLTYPTYPYKFASDYEALTKKIKEIEELVKNFADTPDSGQFLKISTKLWHAYGRADRSKPTGDDETGQRSAVIVSILGLFSSLQSRARKYKRLSQTHSPLELADLLSSTNMHDEQEESSTSEEESLDDHDDDDDVTNLIPPRPCATVSMDKPKTVPVYLWNLKYDGEGMSLNSFLENVNELSISRNVPKTQLCTSASDLFTGKAKIWYNSVKDQVRSWDELVFALRKQFLPSDYNDRLFDEIKQRTQGPKESIGLYIATMINMFNRLTCSPTEHLKLKILMKNISPFYQSQLGLVKVQSIQQLIELSRQLEERKEAIENFVPPSRNKKMMEPDLAYVYTDNASTSRASAVEISEISCWNCKKGGHRASECKEPKSKYCFRCGNNGYTVRSCPKCSGSSGNGSRRH